MATKTFVSGAWVGGVWDPTGDPVASDDALLGAGSSDAVINSGAVCRSLDCTGYDGTLSGSAALTIGDGTAGDVTLSPDMTISSTSVFTLVSTVAGNSFTSNGKTVPSITVNGAGGAWTVEDVMSVAAELRVQSGTLLTGGQAVSAYNVNISGSTTRFVTLGASTLMVTGQGLVWNAFNGRNATSSGITFNAGTSVIVLSDTSSSDKNLQVADLTYNVIRLVMGGTGVFIFNGTATFARIETAGTPAAITIKFKETTTYTFTGDTPLPSGASGALVTLISSADGTAYTFNLSGQTISVDYMNIKDLTVTNGTLYCGTHSTNSGGNNANVIFTDPPSGTPLFPAMQLGCRVGF